MDVVLMQILIYGYDAMRYVKSRVDWKHVFAGLTSRSFLSTRLIPSPFQVQLYYNVIDFPSLASHIIVYFSFCGRDKQGQQCIHILLMSLFTSAELPSRRIFSVGGISSPDLAISRIRPASFG